MPDELREGLGMTGTAIAGDVACAENCRRPEACRGGRADQSGGGMRNDRPLPAADASPIMGALAEGAEQVPVGWFAASAFASYLLLAGSLVWTEAVTGLAVAAATAGFAAAWHAGQGRRLHLTVPPGHALARTGVSLVADTARVGTALLRALGSRQAGTESWQPFHPGGRSPRDAGRRALVTLGASLAPNGFVLDVRPSALREAGHGLLVHRLAPAPAPPDPDWPA